MKGIEKIKLWAEDTLRFLFIHFRFIFERRTRTRRRKICSAVKSIRWHVNVCVYSVYRFLAQSPTKWFPSFSRSGMKNVSFLFYWAQLEHQLRRENVAGVTQTIWSQFSRLSHGKTLSRLEKNKNEKMEGICRAETQIYHVTKQKDIAGCLRPFSLHLAMHERET